jgi:diguanylate cyclase (GGDEF)-like protein
MLPVVATLGTNINSTFVCVIIIVSVAVTSMVIATRWRGFLCFLAGVILCLLPQTIAYIDVIGPIPLLATIALGPALWGLGAPVYRQERSLIRAQLEMDHLTQELSRALDKAEFLANRDSLTGLYNRRAFEATANALGSGRQDGQVCLILIDLDHFKSINDCHGHSTGDSVLQKAAETIVETMRPIDVLGRGDGAAARWGGEEFLLLLPHCSLPLAAQVAEALRARLAKLSDPLWPTDLTVSGSLGVARWEPGASLHHCISEADQAMYRAKQAGRNRIAVAQTASSAGGADSPPHSHSARVA